jgi:hypothetical protein
LIALLKEEMLDAFRSAVPTRRQGYPRIFDLRSRALRAGIDQASTVQPILQRILQQCDARFGTTQPEAQPYAELLHHAVYTLEGFVDYLRARLPPPSPSRRRPRAQAFRELLTSVEELGVRDFELADALAETDIEPEEGFAKEKPRNERWRSIIKSRRQEMKKETKR